MSREYRVEEVINVLSSTNPIDMLSNSLDLMQSFLYYSKEDNAKNISDRINEMDNAQSNLCIDNLMYLYPFSFNILKKVMQNNSVENMKENIMDWFDRAEVLHKICNKIMSLFNESEFSDNKISVLEDEINTLNEERDKKNRDIAKLKGKLEEKKNAKNECIELDNEINGLNNQLEEYSDESINAKRQEREGLENKLKTQKKKYEKTLREYNDSLKSNSNGADEALNEAIKKFEEVLDKLPKDEADE